MDIFEDDSDWSPDGPEGHEPDGTSQVEWDRMMSRFQDAGYREGITHGKDLTLQSGFDQGFSEVVSPIGRVVGNLRGSAGGLLGILLTLCGEGGGGGGGKVFLVEPLKGRLAGAGGSGSGSVTAGMGGLVRRTRELISDLGKVGLEQLEPDDIEALEHAKEHEGDGDGVAGAEALSTEIKEEMELKGLEDQLAGFGVRSTGLKGDGLGRGGGKKVWRREGGMRMLEDCERRLAGLFEEVGIPYEGNAVRGTGLGGGVAPNMS